MKLKQLRIENQKSQQDIADYLNISQSNYSKYELGTIEPSITLLIKIANFYGVSLDYLLERNNPNIIDKSILSNKMQELLNLILKLNDTQVDRILGIVQMYLLEYNKEKQRINPIWDN